MKREPDTSVKMGHINRNKSLPRVVSAALGRGGLKIVLVLHPVACKPCCPRRKLKLYYPPQKGRGGKMVDGTEVLSVVLPSHCYQVTNGVGVHIYPLGGGTLSNLGPPILRGIEAHVLYIKFSLKLLRQRLVPSGVWLLLGLLEAVHAYINASTALGGSIKAQLFIIAGTPGPVLRVTYVRNGFGRSKG